MKAWEERWADRCYSSGLPDEVPDGLLYSGRVPSWKAAGLALLRNDLGLRSLGFAQPAPLYWTPTDETEQLELWDWTASRPVSRRTT